MSKNKMSLEPLVVAGISKYFSLNHWHLNGQNESFSRKLLPIII